MNMRVILAFGMAAVTLANQVEMKVHANTTQISPEAVSRSRCELAEQAAKLSPQASVFAAKMGRLQRALAVLPSAAEEANSASQMTANAERVASLANSLYRSNVVRTDGPSNGIDPEVVFALGNHQREMALELGRLEARLSSGNRSHVANELRDSRLELDALVGLSSPLLARTRELSQQLLECR